MNKILELLTLIEVESKNSLALAALAEASKLGFESSHSRTLVAAGTIGSQSANILTQGSKESFVP